MKRASKWLIILSVMIMVFTATSCGPLAEEVVEEAEEVVEEAEKEIEQKQFLVGLSNGHITDAWRTQMITCLQNAFSYYKGIGWVEGEFMVNSAGSDVSLQIQHIRNLIDSGVDLIVINALSSTALNPVIEEAHEKGIIVTTFDNFVESEYVIQAVPNHIQGITVNAKFVLDKIGGKGKVVYISGMDGQPVCVIRDQTVMKIIEEEYPDVELLAKGHGNWDPATAQTIMADFLAAFPQIDAVISQDCMPIGIISAYEAAGKELPPMSGDFRMEFLEKWIELKNETGFEAVGPMNPPGLTSVYALGIGLRLLQGREIKEELLGTGLLEEGPKNSILFDYPVITNDNVEEYFDSTLQKFGYVNFVDVIPTEEEIDALFKE